MLWWFRPKAGRAAFESTELLVLDAVSAALSPEAAKLLQGQVEGMHWIRRNFGGEEVYPRPSRERREHDPLIAFPNRARQVRLATVGLQGPRASGRAEVFVFDGFFGMLEFKPRPRSLGQPTTVARVTVHVDPMLPDDGAEAHRTLGRLHQSISNELERAWTDRPEWAKELSTLNDLFEIELQQGTFVVLSQLADTTFVAVQADASGPVVHRFDTDGSDLGSFTTAQAAFEATV